MTSWSNKTNFLFLLAFLITIEFSIEDCPDYFELEYLKKNFTKSIPLIKTEDRKNVLECSLERISLEHNEFRSIVHHCFPEETRSENYKTITEKCKDVAESDESILFYNLMCMLARDLNMPTKACGDVDAVCRHNLSGSPLVYDSTTVATPTTLPETTAALPPNTTPVRPSPTTNATSTNGTSSNATSTNGTSSNATSTNDTSTNATSTNATSRNACSLSQGQISTNHTAVCDCSRGDEWKTACMFFLILSACLVVLCLVLYHRMRRNQLLSSKTSRNAAEENGGQL